MNPRNATETTDFLARQNRSQTKAEILTTDHTNRHESKNNGVCLDPYYMVRRSCCAARNSPGQIGHKTHKEAQKQKFFFCVFLCSLWPSPLWLRFGYGSAALGNLWSKRTAPFGIKKSRGDAVRSRHAGFSIVYMLAGAALAAVALALLATPTLTLIENLRFAAERELLAQMAKDLRATFEMPADTANIGVVAPDTPGETVTSFDDPLALTVSISVGSVTIPANNHWFAKLEQARGAAYTTGVAYTQGSGSDVYQLGINSYGVRRFLLAGPATETQQRYLLVSLMAPLNRGLAFPQIATVFNDIWNNRWDGIGATAPSAWTGAAGFSANGVGSFSQWNEKTSGARTNAGRLIVERVVQRKYTLTVNNNHPNDTLWVDIGFLPNALVAVPSSGTNLSTAIAAFANGIPEGRVITARRGLSAATAVQVQQFRMTDNATLFVQ